MGILTYTVFFLEVGILNYLNFRIYQTMVNPIACLSIPFTVVLLVCLLFNSPMDFVPFHHEALWIWIAGLFFFGLPGLFSLRRGLSKGVPMKQNTIIVKCIVGLCFLYMFTQLGSLDDIDFGSKEMGEEVGMGGIKGRIANILLATSPLMMCARYNKILKCFLIVSIFYFLFALGSKTYNLYAVATCFFCLYKQKMVKINLWYVLYFLIGGFLIFGVYYTLKIEIENLSNLWEFISRHFYFYLTSGLLPMSEYVHRRVHATEEFVLPFINIVNIWLGNPGASVHSSLWFTTDNFLGTPSNVFTFFGTLYICNNWFMFALYSFIFGLLSYSIHRLSVRKDNLFFHAMNGYNLCVLFFGWFNCSYALPRIWEFFLILPFFYFISLVPKIGNKASCSQ